MYVCLCVCVCVCVCVYMGLAELKEISRTSNYQKDNY